LKETGKENSAMTPLMFSRGKSEKEMFIEFINNYYGPILSKLDAEFGEQWNA